MIVTEVDIFKCIWELEAKPWDKCVSLKKVTRDGDPSPSISSAMTDMKLPEGIHESVNASKKGKG